MVFCECVQLIARPSTNFFLAVSEIFHVIRGGFWACRAMWREDNTSLREELPLQLPAALQITRYSSAIEELEIHKTFWDRGAKWPGWVQIQPDYSSGQEERLSIELEVPMHHPMCLGENPGRLHHSNLLVEILREVLME